MQRNGIRNNPQIILLQSATDFTIFVWLQTLENIEKNNHLMACKRFLGVPVRTPNGAYGDLGRFPLFIISYLSSIKYSFRLLEMVVDGLPKTA